MTTKFSYHPGRVERILCVSEVITCETWSKPTGRLGGRHIIEQFKHSIIICGHTESLLNSDLIWENYFYDKFVMRNTQIHVNQLIGMSKVKCFFFDK